MFNGMNASCGADPCQWEIDGGPFCRACGACPAPEITEALNIRFINLERSPERLAKFLRINSHLSSVERFPAVDGRALDPRELVEKGLITSDLIDPDYYSIGDVGAAMSNIGIWNLAIESNQIVTVAEDDAIFNFDFERRAAGILSNLPPDWDFILWGFNWDLFACFEMIPGVSMCLAQFQQERMRAAIATFQKKHSVLPQAYPLIWAFGLTCYSISPKGARAFKSRLLPLRRLLVSIPEAVRAPPYGGTFRTVGVDNHMNSLYRDLNSFVCFPPLVVTENDHTASTVQESA